MTPIAVVLYLVVVFPEQKPIEYSEQVASIESCTKQVADFAANPPQAILIAGGTIQASCVVHIPPSVEN